MVCSCVNQTSEVCSSHLRSDPVIKSTAASFAPIELRNIPKQAAAVFQNHSTFTSVLSLSWETTYFNLSSFQGSAQSLLNLVQIVEFTRRFDLWYMICLCSIVGCQDWWDIDLQNLWLLLRSLIFMPLHLQHTAAIVIQIKDKTFYMNFAYCCCNDYLRLQPSISCCYS